MTRAADRPRISQPAASDTLARLRELTADPLLVRVSSGMILSPRGQALQEPIREIFFARIEDTLRLEEPVQLGNLVLMLRIGSNEALALLALPAFMRQLQLLAPGATLEVAQRPFDDARTHYGCTHRRICDQLVRACAAL